MIDNNSLVDVLGQCAALIAIGALLRPLVRLLRFQYRAPIVSNPRESALWAISAVGTGWILVMALLPVFMGGAPSDSLISDHVSPASPGDVIGQLLVALIAVGPVFIIMHRRRESLASAGASANNLGRSLVVSVLLLSAVVVWCFLVSRRGDANASSRFADSWALLQFTIVGFAEEFAYRGYLQTRLIGWFGHYRGWVLASVLMAMAHVGHRMVAQQMTGGEALISSASLIPISLFLGFVMLRTQSIVAPGLLHTAINWLNCSQS